jgi:hypothetical protein
LPKRKNHGRCIVRCGLAQISNAKGD